MRITLLPRFPGRGAVARAHFGARAALLCATLATPLAAQPPATGTAAELYPDAHGATRPAAVRELCDDLQRLLRGYGPRARLGVLVVSLERGDTLFSHNADALLSPASNAKLFSTAAALYYLGAAYRFTTEVRARGELKDGVLRGDLVLRGTGDPTLGSPRFAGTARALAALADSVAALGVREVQGDLVGDASFFDAERFGPGWEWYDRLAWYGPPVGALSFAENLRAGARPVDDPAAYTLAAFGRSLRERGVRVRGRTRVEHAARATGPERLLATHVSPPLAEVARVTNHVSHNLYAEALLKEVGRVVTGEGSFAAGARAVEAFLARAAGVDTAHAVRLVDGSGLSRTNRVTPRATVELLGFMAREGGAEPFLASLPSAGSERGLRRMFGTAAAGALRAKTGTLKDVSALSGYVHAADGERLAFSLIANAVASTAEAKRLEDRVGARLAEFRR